MILDDINDEVERYGEELMIEGINAIDHYAKRLGVTPNELFDFVEERAMEIYEFSKTEGVRTALMSGWMDGWTKGFATAERIRDG